MRPTLGKLWFYGSCCAFVDAFQAVYAFGIGELLPWQLEDANLHGAHFDAFAAAVLGASHWVSLQAEEAEAVQDGQERPVRTGVSAPASWDVRRQN